MSFVERATGDAVAGSRTSSPDEAAAGERDQVLATKINIPQTRRDHLARSRLIVRLDEGMARAVTLVCTPAGFGKTSLLADWAARAGWPVAWLSLDPEDSNPARFWRYVVVALDRAFGGIGERVLPLLSPVHVQSGQGVVTALINEFVAAPEELALVLDDYHTMQSQAIHDDMAFLLSHLPPQLHVVITSRTDPPLPVARLRAAGQLAELRAADLRFTLQESSVLLREVWGLDLAPEALAALEGRTEGWAVGLQLAALALRERPDADAFLRAFAGTHRYVLDYLSEEVLERQPKRVRTFLLRSSILERLSGPICRAVTGDPDSQDILEGIERANLFLIPLDEERRWYRFHHLFADLLRARLQRAEAGRVPELHQRAAEWCEQHGLIDEAIHHALRSGDGTWAARLVEQHLGETLGRDERALLERWLSRLPHETVRSRPALCLAEGLRQLFLGRLDAVERLLEQAERAVDHGQGPAEFGVLTEVGMVAEVAAAIALLRSELAGVRGDPEQMAEYARSALAEMAEDEHGPRFWARWLAEAEAEWMRGRLAEAERASAELLAEGRAAPDPHPGMVAPFPLGQLQQERGRLTAALRTHREGLRLATQGARTSTYHAGLAHLGIAQVLYERNELDDARQHVGASFELGRQERWFREHERVASAWIHQALGEADSALEAMNEACRLQASPQANSHWYPARSERARLFLAQGQTPEAERWAEERALTENDEVSYVRERDHLVLARVLLARSDPGRALRLLDRLDALAESQGRQGSLIQIRAVRSLALQSAGDHQAALALLADALARGAPEGYLRVFLDEGPPMAALLHDLLAGRRQEQVAPADAVPRDHLAHLVDAFEQAGLPIRPPVGRGGVVVAGLVEPLSARELEVLGLLAAGAPNRAIAEQLVVTPATVKKHLSRLFDKLGVANRTQAVARARALGLLP
jgi:LuxR family maltose regulon positive regulatory protein